MSTLTNKLGLPQAIVDAVRAVEYSMGPADMSVTGLLKPPRMVALERRYAGQGTEDAADRIYALEGTITHKILEEAAAADPAVTTELRLYMERQGYTISGQMDHLEHVGDPAHKRVHMTDYKRTSVWAVMHGLKPEHNRQLQMYTTLLEEAGYTVLSAQIVYMLRDWQKSKVGQEKGYPEYQAVRLDVPIWPAVDREAMIWGLLTRHKMAKSHLPRCTPEERWERGAKWAIHKKGVKRAAKLFDPAEKEEAEAHAAGLMESKKGAV